MRHFVLASFTALMLSVSPLPAADPAPDPIAPTVKMPAKVDVQPGRMATVTIESNSKNTIYRVLGKGIDAFREFDPDPFKVRIRLISYQPGTFYVTASASLGDRLVDGVTEVIVSDPAPPKPVDPPTPPTPPGPPPSPPIPSEGLHALIVYESSQLKQLPTSQSAVLYGGEVRAYLNSKCPVGPDGKTPEWRCWDQNVPTGAEAKFWQDMMARKRDKVPWLIVTNGRASFEGPLPTTVEDTLKLLKQYGG